VARHHLALAELSEADLADIGATVEDLMCEIFKVDVKQAVTALERRMNRVMTAAWRAAAAEGLTTNLATLVGGAYSESRLSAFLRKLGLKLSAPLTPPQEKVIESRLRAINRLSKQEAVRQAKGKFVFGAVDARAVAATAEQQLLWVNGFYSEQLSARIAAVTKDVLLEQGLSHREAGRTLMQALRKDLGLAPGASASEFAVSVPARYAGNPEYYFQQVASVSGHQSRVFGRMRGFSDVGVTTFELVNPLDERTGQVCREMHGQVFTVAAGVDRMDALIASKTPDEVKVAAPWLSGKALHEALAGTKPGSVEATGRLQGLNTVLPPFHPLCRTEPVIVS